jgi:putative hemolysin
MVWEVSEVCTLVSDSILEKLASAFPAALLRRVLGLRQLDSLWAQASKRTGSLAERVLAALDVECNCDEDDLRLIPRTGPVIIMANHPHGILDGILAVSLLTRVRSDVKIVSTSMLSFLPGISKQLIAVEVFQTRTAKTENMKALRQAIRWLESGGLLLVFPAGAVSRFSFLCMGATDARWSPHFVALAKRVSAKMIPLFISGSNSILFHAMSLVKDELGTAMLTRELMKKRNSRVAVQIGHTITAEALSRFETRREATKYVHFRTYLLANRSRQSAPAATPSAMEIGEPIHTRLLIRDIELLPDDARLHATNEYSVYIAHAREIPNVLLEIGRLREVSFRAEGEGTGCSLDLDQFDDRYQHLFVWHNHRQEIVGAYRLGLSEEIIPN